MSQPSAQDLHLGAHEGTGGQFIDPAPDDTAAGGGGPLDDIRSGIKAFLDVGISIGKSVDSQTANVQALLRRLNFNTPIDYGANASGTFPAAGNLVLNLGTPDQGTYWEVESCATGGLDVNITAAGSAGLYVSGYLPLTGTSQTPGMTSLCDRAATFPNVAFYGGRDIVVNDQEYLFLIVFGGTVGQQYAANAQVSVFNTASARGNVEVTS
jgi:hypothetical protein